MESFKKKGGTDDGWKQILTLYDATGYVLYGHFTTKIPL
jgi:hypothetical protein